MRPRLLDLFCGAGGAAMGYDVELPWAAGFFDGEGSISMHRDKRPGRRPHLRVEIEQTDSRPLLRFHRAVGHGSFSQRSGPRAPNRKLLYRFFAQGGAAEAILIALWPWLSEPKREQAQCVVTQIEEARRVAAEAA